MEEPTSTGHQSVKSSQSFISDLLLKKPYVIWFALIIVVTLVLFLTPVRASIAHVWFYLTASEEAKQLIVAGANPGEVGKFATFTLLGREEMLFPMEGLVVDYAERGTVRVASVANPQSMSNELFLVGSEVTQLTDDQYLKVGIVVSHDGSRIAYNAPAEKRIRGPYFSVQPEGWTVMVMDLATRTITEVGPGRDPQFIDPSDASRITYSSSDGLVLHDVEDGVIETNNLLPELSTSYPIRMNSDGTRALIFNAEQNQYGIYEIDSATRKHKLYAAIPDTFVSATLTDTHVYWVKKGPSTKNELWSLSLAEGSIPKRIFTFQTGFTVSRVIAHH